MKNSMVTIASTTYNMEAFIAEALDSWLAQKTSFPFDILISDDGSTDGTCDVVRRYMEKYPNIRLISTGHIGKMPNFIRSLKESKGKYIAAVCAGPSVPGSLGLLAGRNATCFPGWEDKLFCGEYTGEGVTVDGRIITGRGLGFSIELALELIKILVSEEMSADLRGRIQHPDTI